jgi:hypothetical protein
MAGRKLGFTGLERTVIAGIEARTAEIIVILDSEAVGSLIGAAA